MQEVSICTEIPFLSLRNGASVIHKGESARALRTYEEHLYILPNGMLSFIQLSM
jgi:hypothetical protein